MPVEKILKAAKEGKEDRPGETAHTTGDRPGETVHMTSKGTRRPGFKSRLE